MKKAKNNKPKPKPKPKPAKKLTPQQKQQQQINELIAANNATNAALSTSNAAGAAALSTASASSAAAILSTSNSAAAANLSTSNSAAAAILSTSNSAAAAVLSTSNSAASALSTAASTAASNTADELQNAVNNLAIVANTASSGYLRVVGGVSGNSYYAATNSAALDAGNYVASYAASPSATLNGNNFLNLPTAINGTASNNWYIIGNAGTSANTIIGNSSANTIIGGSGADIITSGGGADSIVGGAGNDTLNFANGALTSNVTLNGGTGTNTINFTAAATVANSDFANVSNVTTITGTNGSLNISVGSSAQAAGVSTITGGTSADSFSDVLTSGTVPFTFIGGSGADTFTFATAARFGLNNVTAGTASDTIIITTAGESLVDSTFARITGTIEALSLAGGANSVALGSTARNIGLTTITTGDGADSITVDANFTNAATFNAGAGNDTFVINSTQAVTFNGGLGDDTFSTAQTGTNIFNSVMIGSAGTNVLAFGTSGATITDVAQWTSSSNIQSITSAGAIDATLGVHAAAAGVVNVSGSTGADTFSYSGSTAITFTGGSGADSFTVTDGTASSTFLGGDGNDTFTFTTSAALLAASVDGGAGSNAVVINHSASATDADFSRIAAGTVQALTINGSGSSIIVGSTALAAGITTITGGTAADTIIANYGTTAVTLSGGGGADVLNATSSLNATFQFADMTNFDASVTPSGSALGTNTLAFANAVTFGNANFTNSSNIQTLQLNANAASAITVGTSAAPAGFTSITAANATTGSVFTLGGFTSAISFVGSSGNDTFVVGDVVGFTSASSINAGAGTDTISFGIAGGTVTDTIFQKITAGTAEVLSATSSSTITVGSNALNAGIRTFSAGTDAVGFTVSSGFGTNGMNLTGSSNADTFTFVDGSALGNSTINGGVGADSIVFTNAVTITSIANVSNVEAISLNGTSSSTLTIGNGGVFGTNTLTISGTAAANSIDASSRTSGAINYLGSNSADSFTGGGSNDTLQGWATANSSTIDTLTGGNGADVFVIATGYDGTAIGTLGYGVSGTNSGYAIITDFGLNDKISLGGIDATTGAGATAGGIVVSALGSTGFSIQLSGVEIARATYAGGATSAQFI
jgi:hypothetical protein